MDRSIIRRISAAALIVSVWSGVLVVTPAVYGQKTDTPASTRSDKKDDKKAAPAATPAPVNKTLAVKEDPAMIGKRNINSGLGDKFFGWLGGSREKEMQIGRQMAMEIEQQAKLVDDPMVTEYVNRVGQNIVLHSDAKVPFTIKVIDSDEVNAFALPGGFFFVNRGLILAADNESELAGVMAHEIAHVAARHAMENEGKSTAMSYGALAGMIFGPAIVGSILYNGGGILQGLAQLKFSRGAEEEADRLGVQYLYAAGYDPTSMAAMFEKLASQNKKKPGTIAKLFSTHPQSVNRRDTSLALVARFPEKEEYVISTSEFQRVKDHVMKITNARASISTDYDNNDDTRPTLKKRQPGDAVDKDDSGLGADSGSSSSTADGPPKLKKRDVEPTETPGSGSAPTMKPQPTPTPTPHD
ncbi:MAG TPA: M48 family metallopeptidase [Pyrinomonadaceae bacterium]|nr:M48 family metallopeptidase [Pyrinomonadaceae bacterium]